ncbi:hypothetical protein F25303_11761 [Fusarium sp. NRRL 25303]|nr:hypothetical protein F25303_11761 [Fusarium sp. NRRL 25303]
MASTGFDHSAVDALNLEVRRAHMNAFFMHLGVWDSVKVARTREKCVELFCKFLHEQGYVSISHEYFEYEVDALVWDNYLKRKKILTKANEWPWSETVPRKDDPTTQTSLVYRDWLRSMLLVKSEEDDGEANPLKTPKAQDHELPATLVDGRGIKKEKEQF